MQLSPHQLHTDWLNLPRAHNKNSRKYVAALGQMSVVRVCWVPSTTPSPETHS